MGYKMYGDVRFSFMHVYVCLPGAYGGQKRVPDIFFGAGVVGICKTSDFSVSAGNQT